jgi:hypothetical protein
MVRDTKRLSLHPLQFEEAVATIFKVKPPKDKAKNPCNPKVKKPRD